MYGFVLSCGDDKFYDLCTVLLLSTGMWFYDEYKATKELAERTEDDREVVIEKTG